MTETTYILTWSQHQLSHFISFLLLIFVLIQSVPFSLGFVDDMTNLSFGIFITE